MRLPSSKYKVCELQKLQGIVQTCIVTLLNNESVYYEHKGDMEGSKTIYNKTGIAPESIGLILLWLWAILMTLI